MASSKELNDIAKRLRIHSLNMTAASNSGHPTTCMSMAEIASVLFFDEMAYNINDPHDQANDEIVLSKGHAAPILWAAYAEAGILKESELSTLRKIDSDLEGHPTPRMPWIKAATGSLGQGLCVGLGIALSQHMRKTQARTYVVLGDGELAEGSIWEAAALASHHQAHNLVAIADVNALGQSGGTLHGHDTKRWAEKFEAFGWYAIEADGHDVDALKAAFKQARGIKMPVAIIAKTFKGKGVSFLEGKENWHGKPVTKEDLHKALAELGPLPNVDAKRLVRTPHSSMKPHPHVTQKMVLPSYKKGELVATRQAYGNALKRLGDVNSTIVVLDAETKNSTFAEMFMKAHGDRFVECFIAEQNMVGMAVGFGAKGFVPFTSSFAAFLTRAHDFIRMAAYSESNLKVVGSHVGVSIGADGASQMGLEDLGMMRPIPNCVVLYPSCAVTAERLTEQLASYKHVGYLRTTREKLAVLYDNTEEFPFGGSKILRQSKDDTLTIVSAGITLHEALKAHDTLVKEGIHVCVIDAYSVKPLDRKTILACAKKTSGKVLVVEDHYPEGGLGEAVAMETTGNGLAISHLCVRDIPRSGEPYELLEKYGIDAAAICKEAKKMVSARAH